MKYFLKSVKYFVWLCVLCTAIMLLNDWLGWAQLSFSESLQAMFSTTRGRLLPLVILIASACYPKFGFARRRIEGDVVEHRTQIINAMKDSGFDLVREQDEVMYFRADTFLRKLYYLWDDEVAVSQYGQWIIVEGARRGVAMSTYRLQGFINVAKRDEK